MLQKMPMFISTDLVLESGLVFEILCAGSCRLDVRLPSKDS